MKLHENDLISELYEQNIWLIGKLEPQLCQNVSEKFNKKVDICRVVRNGHLSHLNPRIDNLSINQKILKIFTNWFTPYIKRIFRHLKNIQL